MLFLGIPTFVEGTTKLHYILNRLALAPSYETANRIRGRMFDEVSNHPNGTLRHLPSHNVAVFAVDSLDQSNHHGITVKGSTMHGIHVTEIQAVSVNVNNTICRKLPLPKQFERPHERIFGAKEFLEGFIPFEINPYTTTYVAMFIGSLYRHQDRLATEDTDKAMSITQLLLSLFEEYHIKVETRYVDVIDENAASRSTVHKIIDRIYELYGKEREEDGCLSVIVGDQPTFKSFFWTN